MDCCQHVVFIVYIVSLSSHSPLFASHSSCFLTSGECGHCDARPCREKSEHCKPSEDSKKCQKRKIQIASQKRSQLPTYHIIPVTHLPLNKLNFTMFLTKHFRALYHFSISVLEQYQSFSSDPETILLSVLLTNDTLFDTFLLQNINKRQPYSQQQYECLQVLICLAMVIYYPLLN